MTRPAGDVPIGAPPADCPAGCAQHLLKLAAQHYDAMDRARGHRLRRERSKATFLARRAGGLAHAAGILRDRARAATPRNT